MIFIKKINLRDPESINGFTLVELLITLAISSIVLTAIYNLFISQNKLYVKEQELISMEQNLRSAMDLMSKEIRMAGYNSSLGINSTSDNNKIIFKKSNKSIQFSLYNSSIDSNPVLGRKLLGSSNKAIAINVENLKFRYCNNTNCNSSAFYIPNVIKIQIYLESYSNKNNLKLQNLSMNRTIYCRNLCLEN